MNKDNEPDRRGAILLRIARTHLETTLRHRLADEDDVSLAGDHRWRNEPWLFEDGAVFITLRKHGDLRGCIGSLTAKHPLIDDVRDNVIAAAQRDPRFPPVEADELADLELEVTLLSPLEPMTVANEADARAQLRPGKDGVVLHHGHRRATFLPQVWDSLPTPEAFLGELKRKAGLSPTFWHDDIRLERYGVSKWGEAHRPGELET